MSLTPFYKRRGYELNEIVLSKDLNVITAEINSYKQIAGNAIFEIGKRLKHVKENDLVHGEFGNWLRTIDIEESQARRLMKVARELDGKRGTYHELGLRALYEIATLPESERNKEHAIPSTGETKTVDEMTVRELREVKRQLKETQQAKELAERHLETAERDAEVLRHTLESIEDQPPQVEIIKEYVESPEKDEKIKEYERLFGDLSIYDGNVTRVTNGDAITYAVYEFSSDVRKFIEKYSYLTHFSREFENMVGDGKSEYKNSIESMFSFLKTVNRILEEEKTITINY
jgi:Protein of unknown function (DUF3102)